ncbi:MAG TPA: ABC-F family ATP-binding cassette domain-containing protein [Acidothermaceae bacterium]|nr:ABC-F family ATP-binding cassette domain-containing protein [Acidothermaceae bacterium]
MSVTNLLSVESVSLSYGVRPILDNVSLGIADRERVGIVGRNGAGKTTLLRVLGSLEPPDTGRVATSSGLRVGVLAQGDALDPSAIARDVVLGARREHDWAADRVLREIVATLLRDDTLDRAVGTLSGGERRRVALASLLVDDPDLLLLDEPTNHLDVETIAWLAKHLAGRRGALVVVTHDRWFLDEVCTQTWEVEAGSVMRYAGGYAAYVLARAERERIAAATEARRQNLLRKELAWLRRGPPARTSKPQFRIDAANALIADEPPARDSMQLAKFSSVRLGKSVFDLEEGSLRFAERPILNDVTWRLGPGDRIGLVGVNGSGKTTLLRVLAGLQPLDDGQLRVGQTVRIGYLSQDVAELDPTMRVLEAVESVQRRMTLGDGRELTASALLERFGFTGDRQWTPVGDLSGGERRRLQLLRLLMDEPNVLLLDEPTNDLDLDTLTALEDLLDGWAGTLIAASHDRYFLERVCDDVVALVGRGALVGLPGGVDEYLETRRAPVGQPVGARPAAAADARANAGAAREARKEMTRLERQLDKLVEKERLLHEQLVIAATDYEQLQTLHSELRAVHDERARVEESWLAAAERLEL